MKIRHAIGWIFILSFAAFVFFIGWTQWKVEPGQVGIVKSKINGVSENIVLPGKFSWHWEFLLPTNAVLVTFSTGERTIQRSIQGALPDAALYSKTAEDGASYDFTYTIQIEAVASVESGAIAKLCANGTITDEASLTDYIEKKTAQAAEKIAARMMTVSEKSSSMNGIISDGESELGAAGGELGAAGGALMGQNLADMVGDTGEVNFSSIRLVTAHLPDMKLYRTVKEQYYRALQEKKERKEAMQKAVAGLLQQYPELQDSAAGAALMTMSNAASMTSGKEDKVGNNVNAANAMRAQDAPRRVLRAIRGASGVSEDSEEKIKDSVIKMCEQLFTQNALRTEDVVSVVFTVTNDIQAMNSATALRKGAANNMVGDVDVSRIALFCAQEPQVRGMKDHIIRVMVTAYMEENTEVKTAYINGAENLRG